MKEMNRLSSNATLFWKFFIPVFYTSFFGLFLLATLVFENDISAFESNVVKVTMVTVYFLFIFLMYKTLFNLKRVEEMGDHLYVSDYFNSYKYLKSEIGQVKSRNLGLFNVITITMKAKTSLGKKIRYIGSEKTIANLL